MSQKNTYESIFRFSTVDNRAVAKPEELIAGLQNQFFYEHIVKDQELSELMSMTNFTHPQGSTILKIETQRNNQKKVSEFHQLLLSHLENEDQFNLSRELRKINIDLLQLKSIYSTRKNKNGLKEEIDYLESKLANSKPGAILQVGSFKTASTKKLYLFAFALSIMGGIFVVVFSEGIQAVQMRLKASVNI